MPILGSSSSAPNKDMVSKIWTNWAQLSDCIENIVGKGEIAHYGQFLLFPKSFQKQSVVDVSNKSIYGVNTKQLNFRLKVPIEAS